MTVNGITSAIDNYPSHTTKEAVIKAAEVSDKKTSVASESGVEYTPTLESPTKIYKANAEVLARLKADAQERSDKLRTLVEQLITKQGTTYGNATDIWGFLREGNFTVDAETKAQAQEDISENGYWGVNQTSDRIIDFAVALTGGDTSKLDSMLKAFKDGYKQAEKTWGGELPEISKQTYDAVIDKFDKLMNGTV